MIYGWYLCRHAAEQEAARRRASEEAAANRRALEEAQARQKAQEEAERLAKEAIERCEHLSHQMLSSNWRKFFVELALVENLCDC
jgi:hypothetical protein